jgi:TonB family protein
MLNKFLSILFIFVAIIISAQTEKRTNSEPQYPGGQDAMESFIESQQQLVFTEEKVFQVECMVSLKGKITVVKISIDTINVIDRAITKEINNIVNAMPAWIPAKVNGVALEKNITIEINYYSLMVGKKDAHGIKDILPKFPDGDTALEAYILKSIKYPSTAKEKNMEGKVTVKFVVRKDGRITDAKVTKGIGFGCDEEALRIVNSMPLWSPAKINGKTINAYCDVTVNFHLN